MESMTLSAAMQDYLKAIYHLREEGAAAVSTQQLALRLKVAAPSATAMVKKLAGLDLVQHTPYHGVELTAPGEKIALEVVRHHRIIETYLSQALGLSWDQVHEEAERLEHVLSERVEAAMAAALGHPTHDPHGAPIPTLEGTVGRSSQFVLGELPVGAHATVHRVRDEDGDVLRHLRDLGITPGARLSVERAIPAEGVIHLRVEKTPHIIGLVPARAVWVEITPEK